MLGMNLKKLRTLNINSFSINPFARKNFALTKSKPINKSLKPNNTSDHNKKSASQDTPSQRPEFDPQNQEFSKLKLNLIYSLSSEHRNIKLRPDYEQIYKSTLELVSYYSKSKDQAAFDLINSTLTIFLEKHISMFTWEQMVRLSAELARNNLGSVVLFNAISDSLYKRLQMDKQKLMLGTEKENLKVTQMLYYYFSIMAEVSMMEVGTLNWILEYFSNHSNSLFKEDIAQVEVSALNTLYDYLWLTSLSIASILEKRKLFKQVEEYVDITSPVLSDTGSRSLFKILNHLNAVIHLDKNFSENTSNKVRLYKSLYYLKSEGIKIPKNLEKFIKEFQPFIMMNNEKSTTSSSLENKFEKILKDLNIEFEREKKLPFCSVDFFIKPDIVIEVNGPSHFVFNSEYPIAKDLLKKRVMNIEKYDYNPMHYQAIQRKEKELIAALEERFRHIKQGYLQELEEKIKEEKNIFNILEKEKIKRRDQVEERINNAKYLV
jgi:hypothetical protein